MYIFNGYDIGYNAGLQSNTDRYVNPEKLNPERYVSSSYTFGGNFWQEHEKQVSSFYNGIKGYHLGDYRFFKENNY